MDVNMPEMDGLEATAIIRAQSKPQNNIPIIALTAGAMKEDRERCLQAGMNSFVSKPFRLEELEGVVKKYLSVAECNRLPLIHHRFRRPAGHHLHDEFLPYRPRRIIACSFRPKTCIAGA